MDSPVLAPAERQGFTLADLNEGCRIADHLAGARRLVDRYCSKDESRFGDCREQLSRIRAKQNDPKLNLSVVGEFSTGKSAFINALLRTDLLSSHAVQGTTLACTIIEHASRPRLTVQPADESSARPIAVEDVADLRRLLAEITTSPEAASRVRQVNVGLPLPPIGDAYRIIDTPGVNAIEAWHEACTRRTLREVSDVSLIVLAADRTIKGTDLAFIRDNLGDVIGRCAFVVTHLDLLRDAGERERQLAYIAARIADELELDAPLVLPYSPTLMRTAHANVSAASDPLVQASLETETKLKNHLATTRVVVQARRLAALIDALYARLGEAIVAVAGERKRHLEDLQRAKRADVDSFVASWKRQHASDLDDALARLAGRSRDAFPVVAERLRNTVRIAFDSCADVAAVNRCLCDGIGRMCDAALEDLSDNVNAAAESVNRRAADTFTLFQTDLAEYYRQRRLPYCARTALNFVLPSPESGTRIDLASTLDYVGGELRRGRRLRGGGAVAGAAVGSFVMGPVGAVIGAGLGMFFGGKASSGVDEVRRNCLPQVDARLNALMEEARGRMEARLTAYGETLRGHLSAQIDECVGSCRQKIQASIDADTAREKRLGAELAEMEADAQWIGEHRRELAAVLETMTSLKFHPPQNKGETQCKMT